MKRFFYFFMIAGLITSFFDVTAQDDQSGIASKIYARKIAFFTEKLALTPEEAEKFWPVYNEYTTKKNDINKERNDLMKYYLRNEKNLTEKETAGILDRFIGYQEAETTLMETYTEKFRKFLPESKVIKIYITEVEFKRELLQETMQPRPNKR